MLFLPLLPPKEGFICLFSPLPCAKTLLLEGDRLLALPLLEKGSSPLPCAKTLLLEGDKLPAV